MKVYQSKLRLRPTSALAPVIACTVAFTGCSAGPTDSVGGEGVESVATTQEGATAFNLLTWTPRQMPLPTCVARGDTDPSKADYFPDNVQTSDGRGFQYYSQHILDVLANSWGRVPGVSFYGSCSAPSRLTLYIYPGGGGGACSPSGDCVIRPMDDDGQVVHEVGHGLGFYHEHQRSDAVICASMQAYTDAWNRCLAAFNSTPKQPCSVADYNKIFEDPNLGIPGVTVPTIITQDQANAIVANFSGTYPPVPYDIVPLTPYDPLSVMNYCSGDFGRTDYIPTAWDLLGLEMLYPLETGHPVRCSQGCFNTGSGVVVLTTGAITSDWTARGALSVPMSLSPAHPATATTVAATSLPAGTTTITYEFLDPRGHRHSNTGVAVKSNTMFAAIAASIRLL